MFRRLGCLPLLLLLIYQLVVQAADVPPHEEAPTSCVDGCSKRTLLNIIWGCLSTTIICAWTAIHPNIPPQEQPVKRLLRRLELIIWTIVAPEILPAWALNQWLAAITVRDVYNNKVYEYAKRGRGKSDYKKTLKRWFSFSELKEAASFEWTLKHGHFLIMGGFHLVELVERNLTSLEATTAPGVPTLEGQTDGENGRPQVTEGKVTVLTLEMLRELLKDPEFRIQITDAGIGDKSKGDALTKIILILQSSWFIGQCIARVAQGLSITQLEITTLALASLNGITSIFWWDKPLGVEVPVRVYMNRKLTDLERPTEGRGQSTRSKYKDFLAPQGSNATDSEHEHAGRTCIMRRETVRITIFAILLSPILIPAAFCTAYFFTMSDIMWTCSSFPADETHVPTFYVPRHRYSKYYHIWVLMAFAVIFSGIHCAGWNLPFPTTLERDLWQFGCIAVPACIILPSAMLVVIFLFAQTFIHIVKLIYIIILFLISCLLRVVRPHPVDLIEDNLNSAIATLPTTCSSFIQLSEIRSEYSTPEGISTLQQLSIWFMLSYGAARLLLLGLAIILLRQQPPSAFIAVEWAKFYPHIS